MKKSCLLRRSQQLTCMLCMWSTCTCLKQCSHTLWLSNLDRVDSTERAKVFIWRNVGPTRRVTQSSQKGDPARQVTLLEEPTFCFSCLVLKGNVRKVGLLRVARQADDAFLPGGTTFLHLNRAWVWNLPYNFIA